MIKYTNKIDTTNMTISELQVFPSRQKAIQFMKQDMEHRTMRDMNNPNNISMNSRWQVQVFSEVNSAPVETNTTATYTKLNSLISTAADLSDTPKQSTLRTGTKAEKVRQIVQNMNGQDGIRSKDIIQEIMTKVGFKQKAASTYYYNAKKALGL